MNWQTSIATGFKDPKRLLMFLEHDSSTFSMAADKLFRTRVPLSFANKMRRGDLNCPLLRQVLPVSQELEDAEGFVNDPLQEATFNRMPGLLHKYHGRVLVTLAGSCAINCRYCFRRHFDYKDNQINVSQWQAIIDYIRRDDSIGEVIFSGGDPLMVQTKRLASYIDSLEKIPHVHTVRFHTRMPIVLPERIDEDFISLIKTTSLNKVVVVHANHPQELCNQTKRAFNDLKQSNVILLNQSVLLRHINDDADILAGLSHALFLQGVLPYYLHKLDKVKGTSHFDVSLARAQKIHQSLQALLPGYLVPKLVQENSGEKHKTLII